MAVQHANMEYSILVLCSPSLLLCVEEYLRLVDEYVLD